MPAGSYVKRMPWGQQKPPMGYGIDWSHPLSKGLVVCWLFNEGAGKRATDLSIAKYSMRLNAASFVNDGITSSGSSVQATIPGFSPIIGSNFSIILKTKLNAESTNNYIFQQYLLDVNPKQIAVIYGYSAGNYEIFASGYTGDNIRTSSQLAVVDKTYHDITYILGDGYLRGYVDAVEKVNVAKNTVFVGPYNIGYVLSSAAGNASNSSITLLNIFSHALSPSEVGQLYETPYCFIEGWNYGRVYSVPSGVIYRGSLIGGSALIGNGVLIGGGLAA